jgi:ParB-like chromosome segregation protein Spo0J
VAYPAAQYLIAAGHRRWTAAVLVGMATIDTIVIDPPTPADLVDIQYTENEDRTDFSDMERAWALAQMKQVLHDAPWEVVEQRFRLSEGRRKQLIRLMAFSPAQQHLIARIRASETQLRPLHAALREGSLTSEQADRILHQLIVRTAQQRPEPASADGAGGTARPTIDSRAAADGAHPTGRGARPAHAAAVVARSAGSIDRTRAERASASSGPGRRPRRRAGAGTPGGAGSAADGDDRRARGAQGT